MSEESLTVAEIQDIFDSHEEMGYDAPFAASTWRQWLELQAKMLNRFARYQRCH